ncbi:MAG: Flp pilus assembly complex ATPase component TadA [Candidatus Schmidhempelia sp.]|nr:Flp pilus assembly complex ATPase component TadA [Candidatus Schmidhempelia sp.]
MSNMNKSIAPYIIEQCKHYQVIPLNDDSHTLTIAVADIDSKRDAQLGFALERKINTVVWTISKFQQEFTHLMLRSTNHINSNMLLSTPEQLSAIELVNQLLLSAIKQRASDIHFEPYQHEYRVRFRIDGVLHIVKSIKSENSMQIVTRLKIMAQLDIAERRLPQDGQLNFNVDNQNWAMRLSTLPVTDGEKIVLRIIQQTKQQIDIQQLGLNQSDLKRYQATLHLPQGLILVCGPTGSGKTMTLYSGLNELNQPQRNICSVEDPIEISLPGINQTQINVKSGLTFSHVLRAFLRQDPDVLMVGEIRDKETAQIAIQAAHTGHLVLSTLHTNSSSEAILRLQQMGIASYLLASGLKLVISQRLLRLLCPSCKKIASQPLPITDLANCDHFEANGCPQCIGGYYGRIGIYELLPITPPIQQQLLTQAIISIPTINQLAIKQGMISLYQSGINLVKQGKTSFTELSRVVGINQLTTMETM